MTAACLTWEGFPEWEFPSNEGGGGWVGGGVGGGGVGGGGGGGGGGHPFCVMEPEFSKQGN